MALYQGTTLVGPLRHNKDRALAPEVHLSDLWMGDELRIESRRDG